MSLTGPYFDRLYRQSDDPWGFRTRFYEARKRQLTLAALPSERYGSIFEPGCSIGVLTALLAARADRVVAMDISAAALANAASVVPATVELRRGAVPSDWPDGSFDLVVLSEVGYYLSGPDCQRLCELAATSATDVVAVHWRHPVDDYPLGGDEAHATLAETAQRHHLAHLVAHVEDDLLLDVWSRDHRSAASRAGLVSP